MQKYRFIVPITIFIEILCISLFLFFALFFSNQNISRIDNPDLSSSQVSLPLNKGSYSVKVTYSTTASDIEYLFNSESQDHTGKLDAMMFSSLRGFFSPYNTELTCDIILFSDMDDLRFIIDQPSNITIHSIDINQNSELGIICALRIALFFIILDIIYLFRKKIVILFNEQNKKYTITILLITIIAGIPSYSSNLFYQHDVSFHLTRIESIKEALLCGQFPVQIHPVHLLGYGYATGTFYPELLLYIPALLRLLGFSIQSSYNIFLILVHFATVLIAYWSIYIIFNYRWIAILGAALYTLAPYRLTDIYYRGAVGEYCALIFFPLIAYALYTFISEEHKCNWVALFIGFTFVLQSHILSVIFVAIYCIIVGIIFIKRFLQHDCLINLIKALFFTVLVNLCFLVPFLDFYQLERYDGINSIQKNGIELSQLFINTLYLDEAPGSNHVIGDTLQNEMPQNIGLVLLLLCACYLIFRKKNDSFTKLGDTSLLLSIVSLLFAWHYFPWDLFLSIPKINTIITSFQFPWRFLGCATLFLTLTACVALLYLLKYFSKPQIMGTVLLLTICGAIHMTDCVIQTSPTLYMDLASIDTTQIGSNNEYLIQGTDVSAVLANGSTIQQTFGNAEINNYIKYGTTITFDVKNGNKTTYLDMPLLYYPGYIAKTSDNMFTVSYGNNNLLRVEVPAGYSGNIEIKYSGKPIYTIANFISLLAFLFLLYIVKRKYYSKEK